METEQCRLTTQQWQFIEFIFPTKRKHKYNLRDIADATLWILCTGCQWRNQPKFFPKWEIVYYYFSKWKSDNTLAHLNSFLNKIERQRKNKAETPSMMSIDSQSVKADSFISIAKGIDGNKKTKVVNAMLLQTHQV